VEFASVQDRYRQTYVDTCKTVVQLLKSEAAKGHCIKQVIYISSTSVYAGRVGEVKEDDTAAEEELLRRPSSKLLLEAERVLLEGFKDSAVKCTILRLAHLVGLPGERSLRHEVARMSARALPKKLAMWPVNVSPAVDISRALLHCMTHPSRCQGVFNVVREDFHPQREQWYAELCNRWSLPALKFTVENQEPMHGGNYRVSSRRLLDTGFSFEPEVRIE
jgi:nucleoside-diphosphate-sugar epimerase